MFDLVCLERATRKSCEGHRGGSNTESDHRIQNCTILQCHFTNYYKPSSKGNRVAGKKTGSLGL